MPAICRGPKHTLLQGQRGQYNRQLTVRNYYKYYAGLLYSLLIKPMISSFSISLGVKVDSRRYYWFIGDFDKLVKEVG